MAGDTYNVRHRLLMTYAELASSRVTLTTGDDLPLTSPGSSPDGDADFPIIHDDVRVTIYFNDIYIGSKTISGTTQERRSGIHSFLKKIDIHAYFSESDYTTLTSPGVGTSITKKKYMVKSSMLRRLE